MDNFELTALPVSELCTRLATGDVSAIDLVEAFCARIEAREGTIQAWAWYDRQRALHQAEMLDRKRQSGEALGPLHGLPVAVKDIIDTCGVPTENGCALDKGRVPDADARVVTRLKEAGAVIMGKTVTTELAFLTPSDTRNPCNTNHTPGGSSSGSAAAVADGMVPLALGTQTGGSVIRPASFCGVVGLKPQFGFLCSKGVLVQSHSLDTVGVFARDPSGAGLLLSALAEESQTFQDLSNTADADAQSELSYGFAALPGWETAAPSVHRGFARLGARLGKRMVNVDLSENFLAAADERAKINAAEMAYHFKRYYDASPELLGVETREGIETGLDVSAQSYLAAKAYQTRLSSEAEGLFDHCDVLICPSAPGPAPESLASTGDSIFNGVWTLTGHPAITLPLLSAPDGLPIGVQLVAPRGDHALLLKAANWLWRRLGPA